MHKKIHGIRMRLDKAIFTKCGKQDIHIECGTLKPLEINCEACIKVDAKESYERCGDCVMQLCARMKVK